MQYFCKQRWIAAGETLIRNIPAVCRNGSYLPGLGETPPDFSCSRRHDPTPPTAHFLHHTPLLSCYTSTQPLALPSRLHAQLITIRPRSGTTLPLPAGSLSLSGSMHFDVLNTKDASSLFPADSKERDRQHSTYFTSGAVSGSAGASISPSHDPLDLTSPAAPAIIPPPEAQRSHEGHSTHWTPPETFIEKVQDTMYENSAVINTFIAGGLAGATSRTVVSPLERLKIIL
jgi:hypothetical protein